MLDIQYEKSFKKDYKRALRRGCNSALLEEVLDILIREEPLPPKYRDHALSGNYKGFRECHITPDWLLIYKVLSNELVLLLIRTGSHSELF